MTKIEAIQAMEQGKKVTHRYFAPDEYITMDQDHIHTEEGYSCPAETFWEYREGESWETDWELFEKNIPSTNK